jgi:hypothetical protein
LGRKRRAGAKPITKKPVAPAREEVTAKVVAPPPVTLLLSTRFAFRPSAGLRQLSP